MSLHLTDCDGDGMLDSVVYPKPVQGESVWDYLERWGSFVSSLMSMAGELWSELEAQEDDRRFVEAVNRMEANLSARFGEGELSE